MRGKTHRRQSGKIANAATTRTEKDSKPATVQCTAFKRARYFPPKKVLMCRAYCPHCKRLCVYGDGHEVIEQFPQHRCPVNHYWKGPSDA